MTLPSIPVPVLQASDLDDQAVTLLDHVRDVMATYGLQLNMQAGKTELVCQYHGAGAATYRHRRFVEHAGCLPLRDGAYFHVVGQYQHLGTAFSQSLSILFKLNLMVASARLLPLSAKCLAEFFLQSTTCTCSSTTSSGIARAFHCLSWIRYLATSQPSSIHSVGTRNHQLATTDSF